MNSAFDDFHKDNFSNVVKHLLVLLNKHEAEEVAQEAFLQLFIKFESDCESKSIDLGNEHKALLFVTAHNLAISRLRHKSVRQRYINDVEITQLTTTDKIEKDFESIENKDKLLSAINQLPPMCRQVFVDRRINNQSYQEISKRLDISIKTVENHLTKGLKLCRQYLIEFDSRTSSKKRAK